MKHRTLPRIWPHYRLLPKSIQELADKNFDLLQADPHHPSLHFKKVGRTEQLWSARVGLHYRARGVEKPDGIVWFWIGPHAEYDDLLASFTAAQRRWRRRLWLWTRSSSIFPC